MSTSTNTQIRYGFYAALAASVLWGGQAVTALVFREHISFFANNLLLHVFALAGILVYALIRRTDMGPALSRIMGNRDVARNYLLAGACQFFCYMLFYFAVQNGPPIPSMLLHFSWPFVFAILNAVRPVTWALRSSRYELTVTFLSLIGFLFVIRAALGYDGDYVISAKAALIAGFLSTLFGGGNAFFDNRAVGIARDEADKNMADNGLPPLFFNAALILRFAGGTLAGLICWAVLEQTGHGILMDVSSLTPYALISPLILGLFIYCGAHLFFHHTVATVPQSLMAGTYFLPPMIGVIMLMIAGVHYDQPMLLGAIIILTAIYHLSAGSRSWTANTAAPFLFIFAGIIVLQIPVFLKDVGLMSRELDIEMLGGIDAEVMAAVFAIVIGFLLSRLNDRNKAENVLEIDNINTMGNVIRMAEYAGADKSMLQKIKELVFNLNVSVLDYDVNISRRRRRPILRRLNTAYDALRGIISDSARGRRMPERMEEELEELGRGLSKWVYLRSQVLTASERWSIVLLSFASIVAFLIATDRSPNWYGDLAAIALITTVFILVFQVFDLGANRCETEVADLLNKQTPLLRHGFAPYVPYDLIARKVYLPESKPLSVLTRMRDGRFTRTTIPVIHDESRWLNWTLYTMVFVTLLPLLLDKHSLINFL